MRQTRAYRLGPAWVRIVSPAEMRAYWNTGEPRDKAGAYAIQGLGAVFVEKITGSYTNVMGLPLFEVCESLRKRDIPIWTGAMWPIPPTPDVPISPNGRASSPAPLPKQGTI